MPSCAPRGGPFIAPTAINNLGQVAGYAKASTDAQRPHPRWGWLAT
jgi:hypothetical protein